LRTALSKMCAAVARPARRPAGGAGASAWSHPLSAQKVSDWARSRRRAPRPVGWGRQQQAGGAHGARASGPHGECGGGDHPSDGGAQACGLRLCKTRGPARHRCTRVSGPVASWHGRTTAGVRRPAPERPAGRPAPALSLAGRTGSGDATPARQEPHGTSGRSGWPRAD